MAVSKATRSSKNPFFGGRGVLVPFRRSGESSPSGTPTDADSSAALPAHDDPAFEALHRKGCANISVPVGHPCCDQRQARRDFLARPSQNRSGHASRKCLDGRWFGDGAVPRRSSLVRGR
jgi:hypothetical protein